MFKNETKPSLMFGSGFHSPASVIQNNSQLQPLSFYTSYKKPFFNSFITNALIMQTEGETLQPKTSFWKQAGIYGLEFVGSGSATGISAYISWQLFFRNVNNPFDPEYFDEWIKAQVTYVVFNNVLSTGSICLIGKSLNQRGNWRRALVGVATGTLINVISINLGFVHNWKLTAASFILPPLATVIGYNW